jgi:hypothetical protein
MLGVGRHVLAVVIYWIVIAPAQPLINQRLPNKRFSAEVSKLERQLRSYRAKRRLLPLYS